MRPKRTSRVQLGIGDFVLQAPNPHAQGEYLHVVSRLFPEAMQVLVALDTQNNATLRRWAETWGFTDAWALNAARLHADFWRANPDTLGRWQVVVSTGNWLPIFLPIAPWNIIGGETEAAFRARIESYIAKMKTAPGIHSTPEKDADSRHFEWVVLHHVGRCKQWQIAEQYDDGTGSPDVPAVSRAITETAALIGLTLRPGRGRKLTHK